MKRNIAVIGSTGALTLAMVASLQASFPSADIEVVEKISDRKPGSELASLGMPSFIPGSEDVIVHNFGTKIRNNATPAERSHQWEVLRSEESTVDQVTEELGGFRTLRVVNEASQKQYKQDFSDIRIAILEAGELTDPEEREAAVNAGYKQAYEMLKVVLA